LVANRDAKPFVIFMTIAGLNVDFIGACRAHMLPLASLIAQDIDVTLVAEFNAETMQRFPGGANL
jgi:hypothetical protein